MSPNLSPIIPTSPKKKWLRIIAIGIIGLLVVTLLVIAIMAGLNLWHQNTTNSQVKDELNKVAIAMESKRKETGAYPATISDIITISSNVKLSDGSSFDGTTYCITGTSTSNKSIVFHIDSTKSTQGPLAGSCETGANIPDPSVPGGLAVAFASSVSIKVAWNSSPRAINYTLQCSTDSNFSNSIATKVTDTAGTCENLKPNTTYYYRVKATNNTGDSAWSSSQRMKTLEN